MTDPVTIAAFRGQGEAEAAREALGAAGVAAAVTPRSEAYPRLCDDLFEEGFDLIVGRAEAAAALAIVHDLWPDDPRRARAVAQCPTCGSVAVRRVRRLRLFVVIGALLLVAGELVAQRQLVFLAIGILGVLLLIAKPMRCRSCGERWRDRADVAGDDPAEEPPILCPRCGSEETEIIPRRRERAWTLLVNYILPPLILVWPLRPNRRCATCSHEWR